MTKIENTGRTRKTKNIFNGRSLGKEYIVKAIQQRCVLNVVDKEKSNKVSKKTPPKELLINKMQHQKDTFTVPVLLNS